MCVCQLEDRDRLQNGPIRLTVLDVELISAPSIGNTIVETVETFLTPRVHPNPWLYLITVSSSLSGSVMVASARSKTVDQLTDGQHRLFSKKAEPTGVACLNGVQPSPTRRRHRARVGIKLPALLQGGKRRKISRGRSKPPWQTSRLGHQQILRPSTVRAVYRTKGSAHPCDGPSGMKKNGIPI